MIPTAVITRTFPRSHRGIPKGQALERRGRLLSSVRERRSMTSRGGVRVHPNASTNAVDSSACKHPVESAADQPTFHTVKLPCVKEIEAAACDLRSPRYVRAFQRASARQTSNRTPTGTVERARF